MITKKGAPCRVEANLGTLCRSHLKLAKRDGRNKDIAEHPEKWTDCRAKKRDGTPCQVKARISDDGYCHVHNPKGKFRQQRSGKKGPKSRSSVSRGTRAVCVTTGEMLPKRLKGKLLKLRIEHRTDCAVKDCPYYLALREKGPPEWSLLEDEFEKQQIRHDWNGDGTGVVLD